jgi:hypothetical protein
LISSPLNLRLPPLLAGVAIASSDEIQRDTKDCRRDYYGGLSTGS